MQNSRVATMRKFLAEGFYNMKEMKWKGGDAAEISSPTVGHVDVPRWLSNAIAKGDIITYTI